MKPWGTSLATVGPSLASLPSPSLHGTPWAAAAAASSLPDEAPGTQDRSRSALLVSSKPQRATGEGCESPSTKSSRLGRPLLRA